LRIFSTFPSLVGNTTVTTWCVRSCPRQGPPGGVHAAVQEALLDGHQQMVGQDTEKDMRLACAFSKWWKMGRSSSGLFIARKAASTRVSKM